MKLVLEEIAYNTFKQNSKSEKIEVDLSVKFGIDKQKFDQRVIFLELNMDGITDDDNHQPTRKLFVVATFQYKVDLNQYVTIDGRDEKDYREYLLENQSQDDRDYLMRFLTEINNLVINITSYDESKPSLNIEPVFNMYEEENV